MRKVKVLKLDFISYLKLIAITFLCTGLYWTFFYALGLILNSDEGLNFDELILCLIGTLASVLIVGIIMAIVSFWIFNFTLKHIKKFCIDIEFDGDLNQKVIRVKRFGLFGLIKLLALISVIDACILGTLVLFVSLLSVYWLMGIFIIIGLLISFLINSLFTALLLFFILNAILGMVKGINLRGEFQEINGFDAEKLGSISQPS